MRVLTGLAARFANRLGVSTGAAACLLLAALSARADVINFGTAGNAASWLITGAGATSAASYQIGTSLSITSNGFANGSYVAGGSPQAFDGFWSATDTFTLAAGAVAPTLTFSGLSADDRVVLELNGAIIGAEGGSSPGVGMMSLTDTAATTFTFAAGATGGSVTSGFNFGGINRLTMIVNNTDSGIYGATATFQNAGDYSAASVAASLSYTLVPEPASWALLSMGFAGSLLIGRRNKLIKGVPSKSFA